MYKRGAVAWFFLVLVLFNAVAGQSIIGSRLPCEEEGRDPNEENERDNLSCPFSDELDCFSSSNLCDCMDAQEEGSGLEAFSSISGSGFGLGSLGDVNCSELLF